MKTDAVTELRVARIRRGLSQARLAEIVQTHQGHVSRIERRCATVDADDAAHIAEVLGTRPEELFGADGRAR